MDNLNFILHGDVCFSKGPTELQCLPDAYAICENGICAGVFPQIPRQFKDFPVRDFHDCLIFPGMVDLHIHAPQYAFRGMGMDLELLDWLKTYTFPEEAKYADAQYADRAYTFLVDKMRKSATTRACFFGTVHRGATLLLMDKLEASGLISYVGKVNMDRDAPDDLREPDAGFSAFDTFGFINAAAKYSRTLPILTPRFLPSCSNTLLTELHEVQKAYCIPVQSHLSENPGEVELVARLFPNAAFYGAGYDAYGLFGGDAKTVMAHCIYSTEEEIRLIRDRGVFVAHCPASNMNLSSGIAPIRRYLNLGIRVGLGSDVAGGETESIFRCISDAIQVSKLYWRLVDNRCAPLSFEEGFYLATRGGGEFFGRVGSFLPGYEFDAVVIDDRSLSTADRPPLRSRAERAVYLEADSGFIRSKFVRGTEVSLA